MLCTPIEYISVDVISHLFGKGLHWYLYTVSFSWELLTTSLKVYQWKTPCNNVMFVADKFFFQRISPPIPQPTHPPNPYRTRIYGSRPPLSLGILFFSHKKLIFVIFSEWYKMHDIIHGHIVDKNVHDSDDFQVNLYKGQMGRRWNKPSIVLGLPSWHFQPLFYRPSKRCDVHW